MWPEVALACCLLSAAAWLRYQWMNRRVLRLARRLPTGLPALPLIGHVHHFSSDTEEFAKTFLRLFTQPGKPISCVWIGPLPYFVIHGARDFQTYLSTAKTTEKTREYDLFKFVFGEGLVTAPVHMWKTTRRHMSPIFRASNVSLLVACFNDSARALLADLDAGAGRKVDVHGPVATAAARNAFKLIGGPDMVIERFEEKAVILLDLIKTVSVLIAKRLMYPWLWFDFTFNFLHKSIISKVEYAYDFIGKHEINKVIDKFENGDLEIADDTGLDVAGPVTVIETFSKLRMKDYRFGEHPYMRGEVTTILSVGAETVSATMCACLTALGSHKTVQDKLYEEVTRINKNILDDISMEEINSMHYLDQVIKETMRRFCIVPVVARRADKDILMGDVVIPAGASVILSILSLHMDPSNYPHPSSFNPENFSPENVAKRAKHSFLPFLAGARDCVARDYAKIQMKITIAQIVRKFHIHSDVDINKLRYKYGVTLTSLNGYWVQLKDRVKM